MGEQASDQSKDANESDDGSPRETPTEKPEPDEDDKKEAAKMMEAYQERPTLILPGTGGAVSGTAVSEWLDDDGNPKSDKDAKDGDAPTAKADTDDDETDAKDFEEQVAKDKEFNAAVIKAAEERAGGEEKAVST
jgi:hypothetical protein